KKAKTVWVKCAGEEKERASVMFLGDFTGTEITPSVVFKTKPSHIPERRQMNDECLHDFGITIRRKAHPAQVEKEFRYAVIKK
ncbi:hypothetical protein PHYSODRAFT_467622, partial [Phytophthora sojae]